MARSEVQFKPRRGNLIQPVLTLNVGQAPLLLFFTLVPSACTIPYVRTDGVLVPEEDGRRRRFSGLVCERVRDIQ